jgi:hypothetical protein
LRNFTTATPEPVLLGLWNLGTHGGQEICIKIFVGNLEVKRSNKQLAAIGSAALKHMCIVGTGWEYVD